MSGANFQKRRFRIAVPSLRRGAHLGRGGWQEAVEHLAWTLGEAAIRRAVEDFGPVDEDGVDAERVADRAGAAAGQVVDAAGRRDADDRRVEQQQIGEGADLDPAAVGDAVETGLVAGQAAANTSFSASGDSALIGSKAGWA
jgi:hypothetical protein